MVNKRVPFVDLVAPHHELEHDLVSVFRSALQTAGFIGGPMVEQFESEFAQFCDTQYCIGVGNGTDALRFALLAAGIRTGDAVVTVPNTFIATTEAISQAGAVPEFVDVDEQTSNMDVTKLREYVETRCYRDGSNGRLVSRRTGRSVTAVVPVHLYGQMADMDPIVAIADANGLVVVEDACQAHGAEYFSAAENSWKKAGSIGKAAAFSFYPGKNLGACGEAGAVTTNDETVARIVRMIRDHGQVRKYYHSIEGYNGRLDAIQAGILTAKLAHLQDWNEKRRHAADRYQELLDVISDRVALPRSMSWSRDVFHLYVIRSEDRDQLQGHLSKSSIDTGIHYPIPLHLQEAYRHLGYRIGDFPVAERLATTILSLPMFPTLQPEHQLLVATHIREFLSRSSHYSVTAAAN